MRCLSKYEKDAYKLIDKARSSADLSIELNVEKLSKNTSATMMIYGYFGSNSLDAKDEEGFYKITPEGLKALDARKANINAGRRANIAIVISIIALIRSFLY